jgi:tetratricopeptide (TPR) repeat protein
MSNPKSISPAAVASNADSDDFKNAKEALRPENLARHPLLREAATLVENGRFEVATKLLWDFLKDRPRDVRALHLLAEITKRQGRFAEAQTLLEQCVELAPDFIASRYVYANILLRLNKPGAALVQADALAKLEPRNPLFRARKATILEKIGDYAAAAALWRELINDYPTRPESWERYGNALRALGSLQESISAYRKFIELEPSSGNAWWHLADVKTFRFNAADIEQMELQLDRAGLTADDRSYLHFSLGKAYADLRLYEKSFNNYAKGNAIRRVGLAHDPDVLTAYVARCKAVMTADLFRENAGSGCDSHAPIFLVGMPRSGSTLAEQILASHSQIEGTRELDDLATISRQLQKTASQEHCDYPDILARLDVPTLRNLGERYLETVQAHRKLNRPFFTDKMGANFAHIGLIQLVLPNAKIVDVRRGPMACCFSNFAQVFPDGQNNAYRLSDLGHCYRDYVELTAHFDRVLPGKVHRLIYEDLVAEPEAEIRRLLDYLGLPFEQDCLHFYKTDRVVTTVSAEQVRRPIYRDTLEQWKNYEPWLGGLKTALGPVHDAWRGVEYA